MCTRIWSRMTCRSTQTFVFSSPPTRKSTPSCGPKSKRLEAPPRCGTRPSTPSNSAMHLSWRGATFSLDSPSSISTPRALHPKMVLPSSIGFVVVAVDGAAGQRERGRGVLCALCCMHCDTARSLQREEGEPKTKTGEEGRRRIKNSPPPASSLQPPPPALQLQLSNSKLKYSNIELPAPHHPAFFPSSRSRPPSLSLSFSPRSVWWCEFPRPKFTPP
mmetsp:Transcript_25452/g.74216  ORF Transcript_25452/g.74216 Transcript_25452/m.74216 type:complete len:218 (-) Transcript_25452:9-662(-)